MLNRRKSLVLTALMACALGAGVLGEGRVYGQSASLPSGIINAQKELDSGQLQTVDQFVKTAFGQIINGADPVAIAKGRKALLGQFGGGVSTPFIVGYSKVIVDTVISTKALDSTKPLSLRLNTVIVLTNCMDSRLSAVIEEALKDPSPAVRYWAAIAANRFLDEALNNPTYKPFAGDKEQQQILRGLKSIGNDTPTGLIADQVLLALSKLTVAEARSTLLNRLNERVTLHARTPNPDISADHKALTAFVVRTGGTPLAQDEMRELARLTYREMVLSLEVLEKRTLSPQEQGLFTQMLMLSEKWLSWSYDGLAKTTVQPVTNFKELVPLNAWAKIRLSLIDFRDKALLKEPVGLKADEVETELIK